MGAVKNGKTWSPELHSIEEEPVPVDIAERQNQVVKAYVATCALVFVIFAWPRACELYVAHVWGWVVMSSVQVFP
jgi:hypothetical protein